MAAKPSPAFEPPRQQGISLHELSAAFAQVMGNRSPPGPPDSPESAHEAAEGAEPQPPSEAEAVSPVLEPPDVEALADDPDDPCRLSPLSLLEAMLFVGNRASQPLSAASAAGLMRGIEPGEIPDLVEQLNRRYAASGCPYEVVSEGPGYRLAIRREYFWLRDQFYGRIREARLSQAAIDVLAIVAYKQPITAEEVSAERGTPSSHLLAQLVRRRLLRIERPPEKPRVAQYYTTDRFLELFGLESLADLPQTDDLEGR
jgi:segregation and condensation protein B